MGSKSSKKGKRSKSSKKYYEVEPVKKAADIEPIKKVEEEIESIDMVEEMNPVVKAGDVESAVKVMGFKPLKRMMDSKSSYVSRLGNYLAYLWQYRTVVKTSVDKVPLSILRNIQHYQ